MRTLALGLLTALLLCGGSCGSGGSGGTVTGGIVGGVLPPRPIWYALAPTSDPLVPIAGACDAGGSTRMLPRSVDLRRDGIIPPVQNQRWNSCVAWTFAYHMLTAAEARRRLDEEEFERRNLRAVDISDPANWFSPDFLYSQRDTLSERRDTAPFEPLCFEPDLDDEGGFELGCMRPEKALRLLMERGASKWDWMCAPVATRQYGSCEPRDTLEGDGALPDVLAAANQRSRRAWQPSSPGAEWFKPECYVRFGLLDSPEDFPLLEMRSWLHDEGTPIGIVVQMREGWMTYRGENQRDVVVRECFPCDIVERRGVCFDATGTDLESQHMMTIVGYDDDFPSAEHYPGMAPEKRGSFLVMNQFGTKWGHQGFMWIPYSELRKIWLAGYGIVAGDPGLKLRPDGIARTACDAFGGNCLNLGERCAQNDLDGSWDNLPDIGPNSDDVPLILGGGEVVDNPNARELVSGDPPLLGDLADENTGDWYLFVVDQPNTAVEISMSKFGDEPLGLKLVDQEQRLMGTSRLDRVGVFESISRVIAVPGTYFVKAFKYDTTAASPYFIGILLEPAVGDDDVNTSNALPLVPATPGVLPPPFTFTGKPGVAAQAADTVGTRDERSGRVDACDWYAVNLPVGASVDVILAGGPFVGFDAWRGSWPDQAALVGVGCRPWADWRHVYLSLPPRPGSMLFVRVFLAEGAQVDPVLGAPYTLEVRTRDGATDDDAPGGASRLDFAPKPGAPSCWQASAQGSVDADDPIDFHRLVAPPGATVMVKLVTQAPLCASSRCSVSAPHGDVCVASDDANAFQLRMPADGRCHEVMLTVAPAGTWVRPIDVVGGAYTLQVEVCLTGEPEDEPAAMPPAAFAEERILFPGRPGFDVVGGDDPVDWYSARGGGLQGGFLLWLTDACADLEVVVVDQATGQALTGTEQPAGPHEVRRVYRGQAPLAASLVSVRSKSGAVTPYRIQVFDLASDPLDERQEGGDGSPQRARETLAWGGSVRDAVHVFDLRDYWRVTVDGAAGTVVPARVGLQVPADGAGMRLTVWDADGHLLGTRTSDGGEDLQIDVFAAAGRTLLVLVDAGVRDQLPGGSFEAYELGVGSRP